MAFYKKKRKFPKRETDFIKEFMQEFKKHIPPKSIWYFKAHGEPFQVRGIPDIVMCMWGIFIALEFKIMRHGKLHVTPYQQQTLTEITEDAKGISYIVWFDEKNADIGVSMKRNKTMQEAIYYLIDDIKLAKHMICSSSEHDLIESGTSL